MTTFRKPRAKNIEAFRKTVLEYYRKSGRHTLPWRATIDPYAIAVSEVMLQQTQASRVVEKYRAFLERFPTVQSLADAPFPEVLALWSGLGYNRRAKFLKEMAQAIVLRYKGTFPRTPAELESLPGIGRYTARAICAFSYNQPTTFIETNIRTVYIHHFFADAADGTPVSDTVLMPLVEATLDVRNPRRWYAALMDYGAALKQTGNRSHRRSAQYVRQGSFAGSSRQLRGALLRILIRGPKSIGTLSTAVTQEIGMHPRRTAVDIETTITALIRDGLIEKRGRTYALANR